MEVFRTILNNKKKSDKTTLTKLMTLEEIGKLKNDIFTLDRSKMVLRMFEAHGQFCASHPWEVIFVTLALIVCATSISYVEPSLQQDGSPLLNSKTSEFAVLGLTRCIAIAYVYLQFSKLRNLGSKYLLGITGVLTLMFSFSLSAAVLSYFGTNLNSLSEATPIFLLLVDLSKACTLAKFALSSKCQGEIINNIGQGMAMVGPMMTLDALVEALVIGVGTLSGVRTLQSLCCFGCLSVMANYLAFMTFYPACLTIVLELTGDHRRLVQIQQLAKVWQLEDESQKPNPVTQKVKMIMSAGLLFVHVHTRFASSIPSSSSSSSSSFLESNIAERALSDATMLSGFDDSRNLTFWQFLFERSSGFSIDYFITMILITVLTIKYIFLDADHSSHHNHHQTTDEELSGEVHPQLGDGDSSVMDGNDGAVKDAPYQSHREVGVQTEHPADSKFYLESDSSDGEEEEVVKKLVDSSTQTSNDELVSGSIREERSPRRLEECVEVFKSPEGAKGLSDDEIVMLVKSKNIAAYNLEDALHDLQRGVHIRRKYISQNLQEQALDNLPYLNYNYSYVKNQCCENVIGYVQVPVGVAGPLLVNGKHYTIPMATTEGCLLASTNRGCRALSYGKGVTSIVTDDAMTRAPLVKFSSILRAAEVKAWLECPENFKIVAEAFNGTSRYARLKKLKVKMISDLLYVRFSAQTGDAMGMNMMSKGCQAALLLIQEKYFNDMEILSLSGNFCTDKKPNAINWIEGRGKSVVSGAIIPGSVVKNVLKTDVDTLVSLNVNKNFIGSIAAGSIGGFNSQAANVVTAMFIATGQDPAQNVSSSCCVTVMKKTDEGDLDMSCTMPCLEVGTVGGGTILPPQAACLEMLGVRGANKEKPGLNACTLANVICSAVMAGELSLLSALATGDLVKSHLKHNRSVANIMQPCLAS